MQDVFLEHEPQLLKDQRPEFLCHLSLRALTCSSLASQAGHIFHPQIQIKEPRWRNFHHIISELQFQPDLHVITGFPRMWHWEVAKQLSASMPPNVIQDITEEDLKIASEANHSKDHKKHSDVSSNLVSDKIRTTNGVLIMGG